MLVNDFENMLREKLLAVYGERFGFSQNKDFVRDRVNSIRRVWCDCELSTLSIYGYLWFMCNNVPVSACVDFLHACDRMPDYIVINILLFYENKYCKEKKDE